MLDPPLIPAQRTPDFASACRLWLTVGLISFGGAPAQIALLHRLVVAERRWVAEPSFTLGLAVALLLPGPEAHQLATWLGICLHGVAGGLVAGLLFILPGAVVMTGLAVLYVAFAGAPAVSALFFGLRGAVLAILTQALVGLARRAVSDRRSAVLALASFVAASLVAQSGSQQGFRDAAGSPNRPHPRPLSHRASGKRQGARRPGFSCCGRERFGLRRPPAGSWPRSARSTPRSRPSRSAAPTPSSPG